jgi:membrane dipeptidase
MTAVTVDGLVFKGAGHNELVAASGLSALHVTAADFLVGFDRVCGDIADWHGLLERDADRLFPVREPDDLERIGDDPRTGIIFGLQNAAPLAEDLRRVEAVWQMGVRVLQLTYNEANLVADGCVEERDAGLSRRGRELVRACNDVGMLIDLSHVGRASCLDVVGLSTQPVVATHTNRAALTVCPRNKDDDVLRAIAETGGVIGASSYGPMCWDGEHAPTGADFVRHVHGMIELVGEDAVGIGTDFPGVPPAGDVDEITRRSLDLYPEIFAPYARRLGNGIVERYPADLPDLGAWPRIPELLRESGLSEETTAKVVGGNWVDVYRRVWGSRGGSAAGLGAASARTAG